MMRNSVVRLSWLNRVSSRKNCLTAIISAVCCVALIAGTTVVRETSTTSGGDVKNAPHPQAVTGATAHPRGSSLASGPPRRDLSASEQIHAAGAIAPGAHIHHADPNINLANAIPPSPGSSTGHAPTAPSGASTQSNQASQKAHLFYRSNDPYASVGNSIENVYNPTTGALVTTLNDGTDETYNAGSAFGAEGNFFVTDDWNGYVSEFNSLGELQPTFATGLSNPLSLAFDSSGNLYVGQQGTDYVAEFNASGVRQSDIGPMDVENAGTDWIDLAPDECTLYYTSEGTDIMRYDKCTNTQLSNFNVDPFSMDDDAFELRILPNGDVLVADSDRDLLLNSSGDVIHTYLCSDLPDCEGSLYSLALDPDGTSFWTGDSNSGYIWRIDISTGDVLQTIDTESGALYGLTINGEQGVAAAGSAATLAPEKGTAYGASLAARYSPSCKHQIVKGDKADPVDCASGDFYHAFTDASIPGYGSALDLTRTYNSLGASTEGIFGYGWTSSYESNLVVNEDDSVTITEADGSQVTATPDGDDYTVPAWADSTLVKNEDGSYTFVRQGTETFNYNSSGQLTSIADSNGATTTLDYSSGKLHTVTDPSGRELTFAYGENGLVSSVTDPMDRETQYAYDDSDDLTSVTDPLGNVTSFTYDDNHLMDTMTMPNGQSGEPDAGDHYTNTYDDSDRVLTQTDPVGQETTYSYSGDNFSTSGGTTTITDPDGNVTTEDYVNGQMVSKTVGSSTWYYGYDQSTFGQTAVEDPDGNSTGGLYDAEGNELDSIDALGNITTYAYNSFNEQTCVALPMAPEPCSSLSPPSEITAGTATISPPASVPPQFVTYTEYDTDGNKIWTTTGDYAPNVTPASQSRTTFDLYNGQSVTLGDNDDSCTNTAPSSELPCATIDPNGVVTELAYDSAGDLTSKSTPDGNADDEVAKTTYGYDTDGEQTSEIAPDGNLSGANAGNYTTATAYNDDGEKTSVTVGGGSGHTVVPRVTTYSYDPDGNEISSAQSASPELVGTTSGSNSSSSLTLDLPKGTLAGDVVVLSTTTSPDSGSETVTTPSGYTSVDSINTGQTTTDVYTHTVGSDDTDVTLSYSTSDAKVAELAVYSGVDTSSPVDVFDDATTGSGTSVEASALTSANPGDELVFIGGAGQQGSAATWSAPGSMTSEAQAQLSGISAILADGSGPASAGSSGAKTGTTTVSGQLAAVLLALAPGIVTTTTAYDADDRPTLVTDPDGNATLTCYDADSNVAETVPAVGVAADSLTASSCPTSYPSDYGDRLATDATTTSYNALGEKVTVTTPAPAGLSGYETTSYSYDPAGLLISVTAPPTSTSEDAPDNVTDYTYDADGELLTTTTGAGTATAATTSNCYDPDGDKTATVPGDGNTSSVASCATSWPYQTSSPYQTAYEYDSLGELLSQTAPATAAAPYGADTYYGYDPAGNQEYLENPDGVTTTSTYTPLDQLATVSYSDDTHDVSYTYDADGNRTAMTDASGTSSYTYNPFDELSSDENGTDQTVSYTQDSLGDTTSITYPLGEGATWADTDTVTFGYDPASQLTWVTDFNGNTSVISDTVDGLPSSVSLGSSGDTVSTSYASNDAPSSITLGDGSTLQEFAYSDAPSGGILSETDTPSSSLSPADYTYDAQSRVTQMTPGTGEPNSYGEDASSNLTTLPTGVSGTYDYASELTSSTLSDTTTDYTYDASGNRTEEAVGDTETVSATYNGASQLTGYENAAANTSSATYDGDGLRTSATSTPTGGSESTQSFVWDTTPAVPQILMDSDNACIYGPTGTPFEQVNLSTGTIQYLNADALGSVRGVVSSAGSLTASTSYDAWGNPETDGGLTADTPFGFAGGYTDPTGLIYLIGRYYDPSTGQFLSVDPAVSITGQPYSYAGDDPVNQSDPSGLLTFPSWLPGGGVVTDAQNGIAGGARSAYHWVQNNTPLGHSTIRVCFGVTFIVAVGGGGSLCVGESDLSQLSVSESANVGFGFFGSAGFSGSYSGACTASQVGGPFWGVNGGFVYGGSYQWGSSGPNHIHVFSGGAGYAGVAGEKSWTWVQAIGGSSCGC